MCRYKEVTVDYGTIFDYKQDMASQSVMIHTKRATSYQLVLARGRRGTEYVCHVFLKV
jgi:hypothetical protein